MADPFADTLRAAVAQVQSTLGSEAGSVGSGGGMLTAIEMILARRPIWIAQLAAREFAHLSARTAPLWRWVRVPGPVSTVAIRGTSMAATVAGAGGLAVTLGIPIVAAVGVWVMLGAGYYQAREAVKEKAFMSGFSQGFTMGVLNWTWDHAVQRFARRFVIRTNAFYPELDREEALSYNEGLIKGFGAGSAVPEAFIDGTSGKIVDKKQAFRIALRRLAGRHDSGPWSENRDQARLQQISYVIELAAAGRVRGLIVPE